jgi:hypothetical protein
MPFERRVTCRKKEEGRRKKEEGRRKKEEGRRKKEHRRVVSVGFLPFVGGQFEGGGIMVVAEDGPAAATRQTSGPNPHVTPYRRHIDAIHTPSDAPRPRRRMERTWENLRGKSRRVSARDTPTTNLGLR